MEKETFLAILKEDSMIFTEKELWEMIDEELAKDPSVMDTDFVDLCLDALDGKFDDEEIRQLNSNKKRIKLSKVFLVAAVIVLILSMTISVCAKRINMNTKAGVVDFTGDHFKVNMASVQKSVDVLTKLEKESVQAVLPNELLKSEYNYNNYQVDEGNSDCKVYYVEFKNEKINGSITISKYNNDYNFAIGQTFADEEYESFEQISKDDKEILIFGDDETSNIYYIIDNVEYLIVINSEYSTAYNIAVTL